MNPFAPADDWIVTIGAMTVEVHDGDGELVVAIDREHAPTKSAALAHCEAMARAFDWGVAHGQEKKRAEICESLGLQREPLQILGIERGEICAA